MHICLKKKNHTLSLKGNHLNSWALSSKSVVWKTINMHFNFILISLFLYCNFIIMCFNSLQSLFYNVHNVPSLDSCYYILSDMISVSLLLSGVTRCSRFLLSVCYLLSILGTSCFPRKAFLPLLGAWRCHVETTVGCCMCSLLLMW